MSVAHKVEVVPVCLAPHPNADNLSIVHVYGFQVVVRTEDWLGVDKGAYIEPDSVVPETEQQFAWLGSKEKDRRIRVKRFRGVISQGLLVPAPQGSEIGDDVAEILGVTHYEPAIRMIHGQNQLVTSGESESPPIGYRPKYDVENMLRYSELFVPGEQVFVTEKIHGCNARFAYQDGRFWCGSRNEWKKESDGNLWWRVIRQYPELQYFLRDYGLGNFTVYGEIYGAVQSLNYGLGRGELRFICFDVWDNNQFRWLNAIDGRSIEAYGIPVVPLVYMGPFNLEELKRMAEGPSLMPNANHYREGIVVKPIRERNNPEIGRVQLKLVSNQYLEKTNE